MEVLLLTKQSSLEDMETFTAFAALTCHANTEKTYIPSDVLKRIIKAGHESILEHINLTYSVKGLSRACLQELARHRHISLSVESTRYTLKKELLDGSIVLSLPEGMDEELQRIIYGYLRTLLDYVEKHPNIPNDQLKYTIPEAVCTNLVLTANVREIRHIISLRSAPVALNEFRVLAYSLYEAVPEEFQYLLQDCVYKESGTC